MKNKRIILWVLVKAFFIIAVILAGRYSEPQYTLVFTFLIIGAVVFGAIEVGFSVITSTQQVNLAYGEVIGCLEAAHRLVGFQKADKVRITLYVPCFFKKDKLKQLIKYLPESEHGYFGSFKKGIDISKGIVGWSFRSNAIFVIPMRLETLTSKVFLIIKTKSPPKYDNTWQFYVALSAHALVFWLKHRGDLLALPIAAG